MSLKNVFLIAVSMTLVSGQRPSFAGSRPIGYPDIIRTTTEGLGNRFGEGDVPTTTVRLPLEAKGDKDLVDRLSKLPVDQQPFWLINWHALEAHRNNPQTFPQKPNVFADSLNPNTQQQLPQSSRPQASQQQLPQSSRPQASQQQFAQSSRPQASQQFPQQQFSQQGFQQQLPQSSQPQVSQQGSQQQQSFLQQQQALQQQQQALLQQQQQLSQERQKFMELQQQFLQQQNNQLGNRFGLEPVSQATQQPNSGSNVQLPNRVTPVNNGRANSVNTHHHRQQNKPRTPYIDN